MASNYVICIRNDNCPAPLEVMELYQWFPEAEAERRGMLRVVDEAGDDFVYPSSYFVVGVDPPGELARTLQEAR